MTNAIGVVKTSLVHPLDRERSRNYAALGILMTNAIGATARRLLQFRRNLKVAGAACGSNLEYQESETTRPNYT